MDIKIQLRSWSWHLQSTDAIELWRDGHPILTIGGDVLARILAHYYWGAQLARALGDPPPEERLAPPRPVEVVPGPDDLPLTPRARWEQARARRSRRPRP